MARIPEEEIERLKKGISLEELAEARGVKLTGNPRNRIGRCPFHQDKTPSLVIDSEKNVWHCLGACQAGGSVIDWMMRAEGVSFRAAVEMLRGGAAVKTEPAPRGPATKMPVLAERADETELIAKVVEHYHRTLKASPEALEYLRARGLEDPEVIDRFKLGYANRTLGYRLPAGQTKRGAELRGKLAELGIYRTSGHEHLAGSLVVPLFDNAGNAVQMYGRKLLDNLRVGTPKHLYLPGPHRGVFNREALGESDTVILCESLIDALTFWCAGHRNVTTAYGVEGFTDEIAEALVEAGIQVVQIAFDRDEAGDRAAVKVSAKLKSMGIETQRVLFPKGMDANSYALKVAPAKKSLGLVIERAEWMSKEAPPPSPEPAPSLVASPDLPAPEAPPAAVIQTTAAEVRAARSSSETKPESDTVPTGITPEPAAAAERAASEAAAPAVPMSPPPAPSTSDGLQIEEQGEETRFHIEDRLWQVKPAGKARAGEETRVHVRVSRTGGGLFVDVLELRAARQRAAFARSAAAELGMDEDALARELMRLLCEIEKRAEAKAKQTLDPSAKAVELSAREQDEALALLRDPKLLDRVLADLHRAGVVGEETNKLVAYLAATSRKLKEPLAIVIQSSSAAGKSSLMDAILALIPEEERVQYSAMTSQSLFYMGGTNLKHKVLAIVEEEGAEQASYALKLLQSEGELTIASAGKDPATGKHATHEYRVEGPVMIFLTTTAIEVDEELLNRCIILAVDEGAEQTAAIHERQREAETLEGLIQSGERTRIRRLHKNAQRLLKPIAVVNPFARQLRFATHATRTRRDHKKYLTLIRTVTLLHQYQREVKTLEQDGQVVEYIEATREDVEMATRLGYAVLGRSLDELPPQTRKLLGKISELVAGRVSEGMERLQVRFTRRELRERTGWGNTQLKVHLKRLEELEYVLMHRSRGPVVYYELVYSEGGDGDEILVGGLDTMQDRSGLEGTGRGPAGTGNRQKPVTGRGAWTSFPSGKKALNGHTKGETAERISAVHAVGAGS